MQARGAEILAADAKVRPSGRGIIAVSTAGNESPVETESPPTSGVKRVRGRAKKSSATVASDSIEVDVQEDAPPPKKPRSRRTVSKEGPAPEPEIQPEDLEEPMEKPKKSRARRPAAADEHSEALVPVETKPRARKPKQAVEVQINTPKKETPSEEPPLPPPTISRRKSVKPAPPLIQEPSSDEALLPPPSARKPRTSFAPPPPREEPKESKSRRRSRHSSDVDESTFSDFNPFQRGTPEAADAAVERERRRRKVSDGRLRKS